MNQHSHLNLNRNVRLSVLFYLDFNISDTPAVDSGLKQAKVFVGRDSLVVDVYPMKSGIQFDNTLEDNIRRRGAMGK